MARCSGSSRSRRRLRCSSSLARRTTTSACRADAAHLTRQRKPHPPFEVGAVRPVTLRSAATAGALALSCALQLPIQPAGAAQVRAGLADLAAGRADWAAFAVTYDDLQGIHGGLILTIHGDGRVEQRVVRTQAGEPRKVSRRDLERLVTLLR